MHRGIMIYGPNNGPELAMLLRRYGEENRNADLMLCHRFPIEISAGLMLTQITDMIQNVEGRVGKDFLDVFIVMPEEDATPPWHVDFGPASYVLTYKKGQDYCLYGLKRTGLWDWWVPGGRWSTYLKAKSNDIKDAHTGELVPMTLAALAAGLPCGDNKVGEWASLRIGDVDWVEVEKQLGDRELNAVTMRKELAEKGIHVPTFREHFFTMYPALADLVGPEVIEGFIHARQMEVYLDFRKTIEALRIEHKYPPDKAFAMEEHRWSNALLERLAPLRAKTLSAWIVGGVVYDLDDLLATEEHILKGLDALEALDEDTIVTVVDVHY